MSTLVGQEVKQLSPIDGAFLIAEKELVELEGKIACLLDRIRPYILQPQPETSPTENIKKSEGQGSGIRERIRAATVRLNQLNVALQNVLSTLDI